MAEPTVSSTGRDPSVSTRSLTVRFFAAAKAAAGTGEVQIPVAPDATVDDLLGALAEHYGTELGGVVAHSSFLLDGIGVDREDRIGTAAGLDILPPFAGG